MAANNSFSYEPMFTKKVDIGGGKRVIMTVTEQEKDELIREFSLNKELVATMIEYIRLYRQEGPSPSESDEIALGQKIFPVISDAMWSKKLSIFSPEIAEEMFQRLETGVLKVDLS